MDDYKYIIYSNAIVEQLTVLGTDRNLDYRQVITVYYENGLKAREERYENDLRHCMTGPAVTIWDITGNTLVRYFLYNTELSFVEWEKRVDYLLHTT